jgi:hypothetical protein
MRRLALVIATIGAAAIGGGCSFLVPVREVPALPQGMRECIGIAAPTCLSIVADREMNNPGLTVTAYRVRCAIPACTPNNGTAEVTLVWSDGSDEFFSTEWASAPEAAPTAPDEPAATIAGST